MICTWESPVAVSYEIGVRLWNWRTGGTEIFWRPFLVAGFEVPPGGHGLLIFPSVPKGRWVRVTTRQRAEGPLRYCPEAL